MPQAAFAFARGKMTHSMRQFREDERGAMAFFMIFLFLLMIMFGGIAVDVMRFETRRVAMQQTMDRAALAAASLTQTRTPTAIANDWFAKAGLDSADLKMVDFSDPTVSAEVDAGRRRVTITSKVRSENFFLTIFSNNEYLEGPTNSQATQGVANVEVILALDITGSMSSPASSSSSKKKITALRESAIDFITIVKEDDTQDTVSIGVVPYASQVNLPANLRARFNATRISSWNGVANAGVPALNCIEVPTSTFPSTGLSTTLTMPLAAIADFTAVTTSTNYLANTGFPVVTVFGKSICGHSPDTSGTTIDESLDTTRNQVMLPTKTTALLTAKIDKLVEGGNTSIAFGMRWATALLDESARPIYTALGDATVQGRPADNVWDPNSGEESTRKIIVLMTDGDHVANNYIYDTYKTGLSPVYRGADGRFAIRFWSASTIALNKGARPTCAGTKEYFVPHLKPNSDTTCNSTTSAGRVAWLATPTWTGSGVVTQLDWSEVWRYMRVDYLVRQLYMRSNVTGATNSGTISNIFRGTYLAAGTLDSLLQQNCTAAKAAGIEVYGIAFGSTVTANGQTQIRNCSSEPKETYYYMAGDNTGLTAAFHKIAEDISELRLTQ